MDLVAIAKTIFRATPDKVYEAFVDPARMKLFWFHRNDEGLKIGETVTWYLGDAEDAFGFPVQVVDLKPNALIHLRWGTGDNSTDIRWVLEETESGDTRLTIEETGFAGKSQEIVERVLDSTGGFNQAIVAAKALVEHNVVINIVADHA